METLQGQPEHESAMLIKLRDILRTQLDNHINSRILIFAPKRDQCKLMAELISNTTPYFANYLTGNIFMKSLILIKYVLVKVRPATRKGVLMQLNKRRKLLTLRQEPWRYFILSQINREHIIHIRKFRFCAWLVSPYNFYFSEKFSS